MAEGAQAAVRAGDGDEPPETAPGDIFEKDALHRIRGAEREHLVARRFDRLHFAKSPTDRLV